jgi:hypothetical protein
MAGSSCSVTHGQDLEQFRAEFRSVEHSIANLARAIAAAGDITALLDELQAARVKRDALAARIQAFERVDVGQFNRSRPEGRIRRHLADWQSLLATRQVQDGRRLLREMLSGPIRFTPEGQTYRFEGEATFGGLITGMADVATFGVAVRGFEPRSRG